MKNINDYEKDEIYKLKMKKRYMKSRPWLKILREPAYKNTFEEIGGVERCTEIEFI